MDFFTPIRLEEKTNPVSRKKKNQSVNNTNPSEKLSDPIAGTEIYTLLAYEVLISWYMRVSIGKNEVRTRRNFLSRWISKF